MPTNETRQALSSALQSYFDGLVASEFVAAESFAVEIAEAKEKAEDLITPKYLVFYWDITDILDAIKMTSAFKGKNATSTQYRISRDQYSIPSNRTDEVSLTDDEDTILARLVKKAAKDIYTLIAPHGKGIVGGYLYDTGEIPPDYDPATSYNKNDLFYDNDQLYLTLGDDTPAGTDPTDTDYFLPVGEEYNTYHKIVYTINYNKEMDPSMITVLDDNLEDGLVKNVLLAWYKLIQEVSMIQLSQIEYDDIKSDIMRSIWYRKKPVRLRTGWF
jgi:hypothetical protein